MPTNMSDPSCWHQQINSEGFCEQCGARAAVNLSIRDREFTWQWTEGVITHWVAAVQTALGFRITFSPLGAIMTAEQAEIFASALQQAVAWVREQEGR